MNNTDHRDHRRITAELKRRFRDVNNQIALLSHHVSVRVELRDVDWTASTSLPSTGRRARARWRGVWVCIRRR